LVEQQKTDITEESTTAAVTKVNKKENKKEGSIIGTEKGRDQENAAGAEIEDLNK
jgi:hypothetical protein